MSKHKSEEFGDRAPVADEVRDVNSANSAPVLVSSPVRACDAEELQTSGLAKWQPPKEVVWLLSSPSMLARDLLAETLLGESRLCH